MGMSVLSPPISAHSANAMLETISTPRRLHRSARIPEGTSRIGYEGCVGGGHHADGCRVEADLAHEQLLDRQPEHEALQGHCDVQGTQPPMQRGPQWRMDVGARS